MSRKWKKVEPASKGLSDPPPDFSRKIEGTSVRRVAEYVHGRRATIRIQNTTQHRSTHAPYTLTLRKRGDSLEHRLHASSSSKQEYLNTTFFSLGLWLSSWDFRSWLIFDCDYCRLTKMGAVKQKVAILNPRAVHPAVTASISWPWNRWRVRIAIPVRWNLSSALWDSGCPLVLITKRMKW